MSGDPSRLRSQLVRRRWFGDTRSSRRWWTTAILVLALALRLWVAISAGNASPVSDGVEYDGYAVNLLAGQGYQFFHEGALRLSDRLPLYPLFLAGFYWLFGRWFLPIRIAQALLSTLTVWLLIRLARRYLTEPVALLAGLLASVYPAFLWYYGPGFILTETVFLFTVVLAVERASVLLEWPTTGRAIGLGLALAACVLVKGFAGLFPIFLWGYLAFFPGWRFGEKSRRIGLSVLVFALCLAPWLARNYLVHKQVVFSTKGGHVFWESNNPTARGGWSPVNPQDEARKGGLTQRQKTYLAQRAKWVRAQMKEVRAIEARHPMAGRSEVEADQAARNKGIDFLMTYPDRVPKLLLRKLILLWNPIGERFFLGFALILPYALLGLWAMRRVHEVGLLWVAILYFNFMALLFYGHPRFRLFFEPFLLVAAAAGLSRTLQAGRRNPVWLAVPVLLLAGTAWMARDVDGALALFQKTFSALGLR